MSSERRRKLKPGKNLKSSASQAEKVVSSPQQVMQLLLPSPAVALAMRKATLAALSGMTDALDGENYDDLEPEEKVDLAIKVLKATQSDPNNAAALVSELAAFMDQYSGGMGDADSAVMHALETEKMPELASAAPARLNGRTDPLEGTLPKSDELDNVTPLPQLKQDYTT